jgi:hypothetical protein
VRSVTAVAAVHGRHAAGDPSAPAAPTTTGVFATNPTYSDSGGGVTLLGQLRWQRYRLIGTDLLLERPFDGTSAVLARNVMALRAQYGVSSAVLTSKTLENWVDATGAFAALDLNNIPRVRAVRVGVVVRSPQREKPNSAGVCEASLACRCCSAPPSSPTSPTGPATASAPRSW